MSTVVTSSSGSSAVSSSAVGQSIPVQSTSRKKATNSASIWLQAHHDSLAHIVTSQQCIRLSDVVADGDYKLLLCCQSEKKLKLFRGSQLHSEHILLETPAALCTFYTDLNKPQTPNIAVAASCHIYIYRNLRPYYKFTLPPLELTTEEKSIWEQIKTIHESNPNSFSTAMDSTKQTELMQRLADIRESGQLLSARSLTALAFKCPSSELITYCTRVVAPQWHTNGQQLPPSTLVQQSVITCMETINKSSLVERSISQLLVGTESQRLYLMEPSGTSIQTIFALPAVPVQLCVLGVLDIEYRIFVVCRNQTIVQVKRGKLLNSTIAVGATIVCICVVDKSLFVATTDAQIHSYSFKGKLQFTIPILPSTSLSSALQPSIASASSSSSLKITCMEVMYQRKLSATVGAALLVVCLSSGEIRCYSGKNCVNSVTTSTSTSFLGLAAAAAGDENANPTAAVASTSSSNQSACVALRFGPYGREENSLITVTASGALTIRMLSRNADFTDGSSQLQSSVAGPPPEQDLPLPIPKKTRLYVEQSAREREFAPAMHNAFQRDLCRLRLQTIQSYVKMSRIGGAQHGQTSGGAGANLTIDCKVFGLGPIFKLRIAIKSASSTKTATNLRISITFNQSVYQLKPSTSSSLAVIPLLVPQVDYIIEHRLLCIDPAASAGSNGQAEQIRIFVSESTSSIPVISALVNMPISEPADDN